MPRKRSLVPRGLCQCGCGERTPIATQTRRKAGWIMGQPMNCCPGHRQRRVTISPLKLAHGAACPLCRDELRFYTDVLIGAVYEQCTNRECANARPHRPRPDPNAGPPKQSEVDRLAKRRDLIARRRAAASSSVGSSGVQRRREA